MSRSSSSALPLLGLVLGLVCLLAEVSNTFITPVQTNHGTVVHSQQVTMNTISHFVYGAAAYKEEPPAGRRGQTAMAVTGVGAKVVAAMSAGLVAAVVSALLAAVTEPIMNRVLVKRMSVKDAIAEMSPAMALSFFTTTLSTNLLKFPLFEAVSMFLSLLPNMSNVVRGLVVGFIFTTATLPITNFRYRMSIQMPVAEAIKPEVLYQAYLPTVVRDMVYAIARNILTALFLATFTGVSPSSATLMFPVVIGACVLSAPFNEIRGFLLQSGAKKLSFGEFFKPVNFVRSTSLGALNMGISVATGYFLTPIVVNLVRRAHSFLDSGSILGLLAIVVSFDLVGLIFAQGFSKKVFSRRVDENKDVIQTIAANTKTNAGNIDSLMKRMESMEEANKRLAEKVVSLGGKVEEP